MTIKQAKAITEHQLNTMLKYLTLTEHEERNRAMLLLSTKAGLRAQEIAYLPWKNVTDGEGNVIKTVHVDSRMAKGSNIRTVPMHSMLKASLVKLRTMRPDDTNVVYGIKRGYRTMSPNGVCKWFERFYKEMGYEHMSSHSGRRTLATNLAQNANKENCSLVDVQRVMGHARLETTERYIEFSQNTPNLIEQFA